MTWPAPDASALEEARDVLLAAPVDGRADALYAGWYAQPVGAVEGFGPWDPPITSLLRAAHPAARSWSPAAAPVVGAGVAGTAVVRTPGGGRRAVCRGEYLTVHGTAGRAPAAGARLRTLDRLGGHVVDGWWRTWGPGWADAETLRAGVTRIYLAPRLRDVAHLTHAVVSATSTVTDTWAVKVGVDASTLARGDGVVAYVPDQVARSVMGQVLARAWGFVRPGRPPLTFALAPGIAWAQDPGDGDSFGEQRCSVLAGVDPGESRSDFLAAAATAFDAAGLDPTQPWLRTQGGRR